VTIWIEAEGVLWEARALGVALMQGLLDMKVTGFPHNQSISEGCHSLIEYFPHKNIDQKTMNEKMNILWPLVRPCIGALETICEIYERVEKDSESNFKIKLIVDNKEDYKNTINILLSRLDENAILGTVLRGLDHITIEDFKHEFQREDYLVTPNNSKLISNTIKIDQYDIMNGYLISGPDKSGFSGIDNMKYRCSLQGTDYALLPNILQTEPVVMSYRVDPMNAIIKDCITKSLWTSVKRVEKKSATGKVVTGYKRGSKELGIPTANLELINTKEHLVDSTGVYAGYARFAKWNEEHQMYRASNDAKNYPFVMSVGFNPYYHGNCLTIEPYLFNDFKDDFYGEHLEIDVLFMLRPMSNFLRFDQLVKAIQLDCQVAYDLLVNDES